MSDNEVRVVPPVEPGSEEEALELERLLNYASCFSGPAGEFVLRDLAEQCLVQDSVCVQGNYNPHMSAFLDGRRSVALRCLRYAGKKLFGL